MKWNDDVPTCHGRKASINLSGSRWDLHWRPPSPEFSENGPITRWRECSYCGSIHPGDLLGLVVQQGNYAPHGAPLEDLYGLPHMEMADRKYGFPHKIYITPNETWFPDKKCLIGTNQDGSPCYTDGYRPHAKFYTEHMLDDGVDDEAFAALADVIVRHTGWYAAQINHPIKGKGFAWTYSPR